MIAWGAEMSGAPQDWQGFKVQDRLVQHPIDIINDIEEKVCFHNMANWPLEVNLVCIDDFSWLWYIYTHYSYIHSPLPVTKCYQSGHIIPYMGLQPTGNW
jgi:hypothetical protein